MNVKKLMIDTIQKQYNYEVILQGSMAEDTTYPASFFTFFNNSVDGNEYYDNVEGSYVWDFDLNFYSNDPELVDTVLLGAKALLKAEGFIIDGKGYDVLSDEPTHTGRGINVLYIEKEEINYGI